MKRTITLTLAALLLALTALAGDQVRSGWGNTSDMAGNPTGEYYASTDGILFIPEVGPASNWLWNSGVYDKVGEPLETWMECECVAYDMQWHCLMWHYKVWQQVSPPGWPPYFLGEGYVY